MEKDFDYSVVPYTFMHCVHAACVRANDCLRHLVMQQVTSGRTSLLVVNPAHVAGDGKSCPYFFADQKTRFASGIKHLLDNVPYKTAVQIRGELYAYFGRSTYYRIRNQERLINLAEQDYIHKIFLRKGINEEPVFDKYVEQYEW